MRALLRELGDPQTRFRSIHVVGSNGKTTTTLMAEAILRGEGIAVGATISPHVGSWEERITVGDFVRAIERVRPAAEHVGATQFEVVIAAAFSEFAEVGVDAAVVEAGLGGRLDATNVIDAPVVVLTNVSLEHTDVLGPTREAIAAEKLAVVTPGATVVLSEPEWEEPARAHGASRVELAQCIDEYRKGLVPLIVPITLIRHYVRVHAIEYLSGQVYLEPHPRELMLRNHV